jgi:uncharacterized membrane protein (DUF2068 family)
MHEKLIPGSSMQAVSRAEQRRRFGFRLIITYKTIKAAVMFVVALWLTAAPGAAYRALDSLAHELTEGGVEFARAGSWIHAHLSSGIVSKGAVLAWLDSLLGTVEVVLLRSGKSWANWIVIAALACLLPLEIRSLAHRLSAGKLLVFIANAAIVAYLAWDQIRKQRA